MKVPAKRAYSPASLFLVREKFELVPLDRVLEPIFLEDAAQGLRHSSDLEDLPPTVDVELDLVRDRKDHPHRAFAVETLRLPVAPQLPQVLLNEDVDALHVLGQLLRLLEEFQEQWPESGDEVLPFHFLVELEVSALGPHLRSGETAAT